MTCCAPGCTRELLSRDMCRMHYQRMAKYGSFELPPKPTVEQRFMAFVQKQDDGCWIWTGCIGNQYGHGRFDKDPAHRASWKLLVGPIPDGMNVLHRCDAPLCVNPKHLFLGTQSDNMKDCVAKGRHRSNPVRGERCSAARLTEEDVLLIRAEHAAGTSQPRLSREHRVALSTISAIVKRVTWKHI